MENYPTYTYPDSSSSSPRSREIDFENPPPSWEDQPPSRQHSNSSSNKVKLMVSYNGKIQPRTHDSMLSYVGGETKIMSIERIVKFTTLFSKLSCILSSDNSNSNRIEGASRFTLKYQLPGEDLDALISVTNDDDLENMLHEYDRLCGGSNKPARLRVFLFPVQKSPWFGSTSSDKIDRFVVEDLNSGLVPISVSPSPSPSPSQPQANSTMDYLFGLEKTPVQYREPDIEELNRVQISVQEMNREKTHAGGGSFFSGAPANIPVEYWQQHQQPPPPQQPISIEQSQPQPQQQQMLPQFQQQQVQQVYMVHPPPQGAVYHAPMLRPMTTNQQMPPQQGGFYREQVYREQPVYSVGPGKYSEGMGVPVRPVASMESYQQQQVGYDRHVYYAAQGQPGSSGLVMEPFQGVSGDMRNVAVDAKVVPK